MAKDERQKSSDEVRFTQTTGAGDYVVEPGDCLSSIAFERGLFWKTIWDHPANSTLKQTRKDPNVLLPGDRIHIPDPAAKTLSGSSDQRHRFVRKGVPEKLKLTLLDADGNPRADIPYALKVDGKRLDGRTNRNGLVEHFIPPGARSGELIIGAGESEERYVLRLGGLDPIDSPTGIQARLNNLGYLTGQVDGIIGPKTREALQRFQVEHQLLATGELDDQTVQALRDAHRF